MSEEPGFTSGAPAASVDTASLPFMQETPCAIFHLDSPVPGGAPLPSGPVTLRGWAAGRDGHVLADLRARSGSHVRPAFFGLPRPDLARHFSAREPFLLAGFELELVLAPGENRIDLEGCEIGLGWQPLGTVVLRATAGPAFAPPPGPPMRVQPPELARALRLVLQRSVAEPVESAAAAVAALLPRSGVIRFAALPFHGHLHQPPLLQCANFGRLIVEGWLFHESEPIRRVAATIDLHAWSYLKREGDPPYVISSFPQFPNARGSRIEGFIDVPSQLPQPVSLRLYAELADGSWHLCHAQHVHVYDGEADKAPYGAFRVGRFFRAVRALRAACRERGFAMTVDCGFFAALREVWIEYRARAVQQVAPAPEFAIPSLPSTPALPGRVALVTHNLNHEGAPLFLLEYAAHLAGRGVKLAVFSAAEGPLRARFEALGAEVRYVDPQPLHRATNATEQDRSLAELAAHVNLAGHSLVVANTLSAFWGVHLAHRAGLPSLFYIHESTTPDAFYHGHLAAGALPGIKRTFTLASHVSFLTEATRRYYRPILRRANHSLNPGWIDLEQLRCFRAANPRAALREALGLAADTRLVINVGTVCDRKGQPAFARAVDLLWRRHPALARECVFLMVGGRGTPFDRVVGELLTDFDRSNLRVVGETPNPYVYYGAADLFVCSSHEESFPRVVLEAMAFALPIVSTNVHGIPEMVRADREAVLVPPGDPVALCAGMADLLGQPERARKLAAAAQRVSVEYDSRLLLPRHSALAATIFAADRRKH